VAEASYLGAGDGDPRVRRPRRYDLRRASAARASLHHL